MNCPRCPAMAEMIASQSQRIGRIRIELERALKELEDTAEQLRQADQAREQLRQIEQIYKQYLEPDDWYLDTKGYNSAARDIREIFEKAKPPLSLKPCTCGGVAVIIRPDDIYAYVSCQACRAIGPRWAGADDDQIIECWNKDK